VVFAFDAFGEVEHLSSQELYGFFAFYLSADSVFELIPSILQLFKPSSPT
jgi:hypothetical protein